MKSGEMSVYLGVVKTFAINWERNREYGYSYKPTTKGATVSMTKPSNTMLWFSFSPYKKLEFKWLKRTRKKILQYILSGALEDHYQFETKTSHTAVKKAMDLPIDETFIETLRQSFVKAYHDWIVTTNATRASNAYQKPLDSEDLESQLAYNASFMVLTTPDKPFTLEPEIQAMIDKYSLTPEK